MTWELGLTIDLDKYSVLVAVGGDGTYHEVVNGMLHRIDKKKIPVAFIPNGSGNDTLRGLSVFDVNQALDYIVKGDSVKLDVTRVLLDHEEIPDASSPQFTSHYRYQLINSSFNVPAKLNARAASWKWCCRCCNPYEVAAAIEFTKLIYEPLDIYLDGQLVLEDLPSSFVMGLQGQHGGNGCLLSPLSIINDGKSELLVVKGRPGVSGMMQFMKESTKGGGVQGYDKNI